MKEGAMNPILESHVMSGGSAFLESAVLIGFGGLVAASCGWLIWLLRDPPARELVKR